MDLAQLATVSTLLIYGAIATYAIAAVAFAADLSAFGKGADPKRRRRAANIAVSVSWLGLMFNVAGLALRGIASSRAPWANMYEFTVMSTMFTVLAFLVVSRYKDIRYLGLPVMLLSFTGLFVAITFLYVAADGVQPALQSYWLIIHVSVATVATALFCVGALASILQLFRGRDERLRMIEASKAGEGDDGVRPAGGQGTQPEGGEGETVSPAGAATSTLVATSTDSGVEGEGAQRLDLGHENDGMPPARNTFGSRLLNAFPSTKSLERLSYRFNAVGLVGWTFVLITGAIWAEYAWGRAWGWDPKEVVSLVVWLAYAAYCHVRLTTGWSRKTFAYFSLAGFAVVLFNYYGVNIFINSLHSYSGI